MSARTEEVDDPALATDLRGLTVAEVMVRRPKTMSSDVSVGAVREALRDDHVHMVLLTDAGVLRGTVVRKDLVEADDGGPALVRSRLAGRTIPPSVSAEEARRMLVDRDQRRLAVVDSEGRLLGLLCLKRRRTGFCSDDDVRARALDGMADTEAALTTGRLDCAVAIVGHSGHHTRPDCHSPRHEGQGAP